eukprot:245895-Amorphochlora_amoeboformis.AAC.1
MPSESTPLPPLNLPPPLPALTSPLEVPQKASPLAHHGPLAPSPANFYENRPKYTNFIENPPEFPTLKPLSIPETSHREEGGESMRFRGRWKDAR